MNKTSLISIGSCNGLVSSGNKPLYVLNVDQVLWSHIALLGHNELILISNGLGNGLGHHATKQHHIVFARIDIAVNTAVWLYCWVRQCDHVRHCWMQLFTKSISLDIQLKKYRKKILRKQQDIGVPRIPSSCYVFWRLCVVLSTHHGTTNRTKAWYWFFLVTSLFSLVSPPRYVDPSNLTTQTLTSLIGWNVFYCTGDHGYGKIWSILGLLKSLHKPKTRHSMYWLILSQDMNHQFQLMWCNAFGLILVHVNKIRIFVLLLPIWGLLLSIANSVTL